MAISTAARFTVSINPELLRAFDSLSEREGFSNRSEAIKSLMRNALIEKEWERDAKVAGALVLVYDHHRRALAPPSQVIFKVFGGRGLEPAIL